jgi:hypothetical protein
MLQRALLGRGGLNMEIPGLGPVTKDDQFDSHCSEPLPVAALGGKICRIIVEDYDNDHAREDFHVAVKNFLSIDQFVLQAAEPYIFQYYLDCNSDFSPDDEDYLIIDSPRDVWKHVKFGDEPIVTRRAYGDHGVYVSLECNCDWEIEHGLQIVFKNGLKVNKIGPYDGNLTNSDAYARNDLEDAIYVPVSNL